MSDYKPTLEEALYELTMSATSPDCYMTPEGFAEALRLVRGTDWDDGARRGGRYGHEDGWYSGGPHRDNPFRTEAEIIEQWGEDEW